MDRYFKEQLAMLRQGAQEFARRYPAVAPMLLEQGGDPDAERILEGVAYLCGKIHQRLDQTAPRLIQSLLRQVFPESVMPVPSMAVMRFDLKTGFNEPLLVQRGAQLASRPIGDQSCLYSTTEDLRVLPLRVQSLQCQYHSGSWGDVTVTLNSSVPLSRFLPDKLDFHLVRPYSVASQQLLVLMTRLAGITVSWGGQTLELPPQALKLRRPPDQDLRMSLKGQSRRSYTSMIRYFCCPDQLMAFSLTGLGPRDRFGDGRELKIGFHFRPGPTELPDFAAQDLALNVVPAVNVFTVPSEPLQVDYTQEAYRIEPHADGRQHTDILGVERAAAVYRGGRTEPCRPYGLHNQPGDGLIYSHHYRLGQEGALPEHFLEVHHRPGSGRSLESCVVALDLLCCNLDLPNRLFQGDICLPTDSSPSQATFENVGAPSPVLSRPDDERLQWRFLAHMNSNLLPVASAEALRQMLRLYAPRPSDSSELAAACDKRLQSIRSFSSQSEERLFRGRLLRGRSLILELDPAGFLSMGDLWIFADSLDQFFAEFAAMNSYTRLTLKVTGTEERWEWPARLGSKQLI